MADITLDTPSLRTDEALEDECISMLSQYLFKKNCNEQYIKNQISILFGLDGFRDRFNYFVPLIQKPVSGKLLISGSAIGSEIITAREYGFKEIFGTEVIQEYVDITKKRLSKTDDAYPIYYDGVHLPFDDNYFSYITSGHIIEHTKSPYAYFIEHMRVLKSGGYFFLEFPDRFHLKELHTNTTSFEYLPLPIRNAALSLMSSSLILQNDEERKKYQAVKNTLRPINIIQIKLYLLMGGYHMSKIIHSYSPLKGYIRMVIKK